jgi:hypothetical protein
MTWIMFMSVEQWRIPAHYPDGVLCAGVGKRPAAMGGNRMAPTESDAGIHIIDLDRNIVYWGDPAKCSHIERNACATCAGLNEQEASVLREYLCRLSDLARTPRPETAQLQGD